MYASEFLGESCGNCLRFLLNENCKHWISYYQMKVIDYKLKWKRSVSDEWITRAVMWFYLSFRFTKWDVISLTWNEIVWLNRNWRAMSNRTYSVLISTNSRNTLKPVLLDGINSIKFAAVGIRLILRKLLSMIAKCNRIWCNRLAAVRSITSCHKSWRFR